MWIKTHPSIFRKWYSIQDDEIDVNDLKGQVQSYFEPRKVKYSA